MEKEEEQDVQAVDLSVLEIEQLLSLFISILVAKAWQYMGIRLTPGKEQTEKDMVKAAAAIDSAEFLSDKLTPNLPENEADKLRTIITDLKINYAKQS